MRRSVPLMVLLGVMLAGPALACPPPSATLLFHSCWGTARADLALLPEDGLPQGSPPLSVTVTGGYTGRDTRGEGLPNPVGLFLRDGEIVNRHLVPMDGVLILTPEGAVSLHHRARVAWGGRRFNLQTPGERAEFVLLAGQSRLDVLQSHLLVVDGLVDVAVQRDAPKFQRRMLFTDRAGWGLFETLGVETLEQAARQIDEALAPQMVLNLDMGSYDFCLTTTAQGAQTCGFLGTADIAKLSNLLTLRLGTP